MPFELLPLGPVPSVVWPLLPEELPPPPLDDALPFVEPLPFVPPFPLVPPLPVPPDELLDVPVAVPTGVEPEVPSAEPPLVPPPLVPVVPLVPPELVVPSDVPPLVEPEPVPTGSVPSPPVAPIGGQSTATYWPLQLYAVGSGAVGSGSRTPPVGVVPSVVPPEDVAPPEPVTDAVDGPSAVSALVEQRTTSPIGTSSRVHVQLAVFFSSSAFAQPVAAAEAAPTARSAKRPELR